MRCTAIATGCTTCSAGTSRARDTPPRATRAPAATWACALRRAVPGYAPLYEGDRTVIREAVRLLEHARKPLILAGNGVLQSAATAELRRFAERAQIPVITTLHGIGALPEDHPLSLGMPGMHGWVHVNRAIQQCDVLFNIGGRFDDRVTGKASTFAPKATVIHVDIDPAELGKNVRADVGIVGDAKRVLGVMLEMPGPPDAARQITTRAWLDEIRELQSKHQPHQAYVRRPNTRQLMPHDVYAALNRLLASSHGGYRVVTDVGQHQMWAAQ